MGLVRYFKNWLRHDRNVRQQLQVIHRQVDSLELLIREANIEQKELQRKSYLQDCVMNCSEMGISSQALCNEEVIVSLTSYGKRINDVYLPIESIMQGTIKPNRIILWLSEEEFANLKLPVTLCRQQKRGLEVRFCKDIRSYTKLLPTIKEFPNSTIITIDDDIMYDFDLVENLLRAHSQYPGYVCANRIHKIVLDNQGVPISYNQWDLCSSNYSDSKLNFMTGVGGVLYPPNVFPQEVFNEDVYLQICKYADDVWFYAMLLLNGKSVIKSFTHATDGCDYIELSHTQERPLCSINTDANCCMNDVQLKAVFDKYNLWHILNV